MKDHPPHRGSSVTSESDHESCFDESHSSVEETYPAGTVHRAKPLRLPLPIEDNKILEFIKTRWNDIVGQQQQPHQHNTNNILVTHYHNVTYVPQGFRPVCGFAAVAMAGTILGKQLDIDEMLSWAQSQNMTEDGHMFEAENLAKVCQRFVEMPTNVIRMPDKAEMFSDLLKGYCFLVPYDYSFTEVPELDHGFFAHWGLVFGAVLPRSHRINLPHMRQLNTCPEIYSCKVTAASSGIACDRGHLLGIQGNSAKPQLWTHHDLAASCNQLRHPGLEGQVLKIDMNY